MNSGTRKSRVVYSLSVALITAISVFMIGSGIAIAGARICGMDTAKAQAAQAKKQGCCCCTASGGNECPTGLQSRCGESRPEQTSTNGSLPTAQNLGIGLVLSPVPVTSQPYAYEDLQTPVFGQKTVYLINAKLIC